jgi:uncharacterized protein
MNLAIKPHLNSSLLESQEFKERLSTLYDGRFGLRSGLQVETSEPSHRDVPQGTIADQETHTRSSAILDFIASDETLDRCDEIIAASGWRLESYRKNPVFQNAHQYGDVIFTLGKALLTEVRMISGRPALFQRVQFAVDANPMARIAYALYKGKFLNAVSVGFVPLRWENPPSPTELRRTGPSTLDPRPFFSPDTRHPTLSSSPFRRRYLEQELLEVSAVGIPANPNALQLGLKAGAIEKGDLKELADLLSSLSNSAQREPNTPLLQHSISTPPLHHSVLSAPPPLSRAACDTNARASGVRGYEAQLLQLARDVLDLLRNS